MVSERVVLRSKNRFSVNLVRLAKLYKADKAIIRDPRVKRQGDGRFRVRGGYLTGAVFFVKIRFIYKNVLAGKGEHRIHESLTATYTFRNKQCKRIGFDEHYYFKNEYNWTEDVLDLEEDGSLWQGFVLIQPNGKVYNYPVHC